MAEQPISPVRQAETQRPTIYALIIVFTSLSFISVCLRLYTRTRILPIFGRDDLTILIAQVLSLGVTTTTISQLAVGGLGRHTEFATRDEFLAGAKGMYSNLLVYNVAQIATKISFLLQYRRLFPSPEMQKTCTYGIAFLSIWGIAQQFITAFTCSPLEMMAPTWHNRCIPSFPVFNVNSVMNILTDFMIFLIPCRPVLKLHISRRRKFYLVIIFSLGFFVCAISIIRLHELHRTRNSTDPIWDSGATAYWSVIELNVGILCACLPTIRPLLKKFLPRLLGSSAHSGHHPKLNTIPITGSGKADTAIYTAKDIEFQSTTQLQAKNAAKSPTEERTESLEELGRHEMHIGNISIDEEMREP